jgi:hypothetical protein
LKFRYVLPVAYAFVALLAWVNFWLLPPDGLANAGLMLVVLPVTLLDLALRSEDRPGSFVLMPDSLGYYGDHAVYFGTSVLIIAGLLWWLGAWIDRQTAKGRRGGS